MLHCLGVKKMFHRSRYKSQLISFWFNLQKILLLYKHLALLLMLKVPVSLRSKTVSRLTCLMSTTYISRYPAMVQCYTLLWILCHGGKTMQLVGKDHKPHKNGKEFLELMHICIVRNVHFWNIEQASVVVCRIHKRKETNTFGFSYITIEKKIYFGW